MAPSKHEALLDTAERLFYAEGFHATGVDRVIAEAGVARMTLYNHFASKDELGEAVLTRRFRRYMEAMRDALGNSRAGESLAALVEVHTRWLATISTRGCIVMKAIGEYDSHVPAIAALGRRLKGDLLEVIEAALAADGYGTDRARAERVLFLFEGADTLVPLLGCDAAIGHLRALLPAARTSAQEVGS